MCADAIVFLVFIVFPLVVVVEVVIDVAVRGRKENQGTRRRRRPPGISNCGYEKLL